MKRRYRYFLLLGLILLLVSSVIGCSQYTKDDVDAAYKEGFNAGFTEGYEAGATQRGTETIPPPIIAPEASSKTEIPTTPEHEVGLPANAISWDEAKDHIGERLTVCGPVKSPTYASGSKGRPTFLNIGKSYPDPDRFTVVIWGENRSNFPEPPESYYKGKDICVTGLIIEYKGIPEIEVTNPSQITEQ